MKITKKEGKCECDQCHKKQNGYRSIYMVTLCSNHFRLCTECLFTLSGMIKDCCSRELGYKEPTEEDVRLEEKLAILLNKKVSDQWNENCEEELKGIPFESISNSNKVLYKSIIDW